MQGIVNCAGFGRLDSPAAWGYNASAAWNRVECSSGREPTFLLAIKRVGARFRFGFETVAVSPVPFIRFKGNFRSRSVQGRSNGIRSNS